MTRSGYAQLQDVILDPDFPELDLALRRGRHIDRDDVAWYALLGDAQDHLEAFYRRYGCELVHKPDGYFYLLPTGDKLPRRQLAGGDMLVGQALALLYLHPSTIERAGLHTMEELVAQLAAVMGSDALIRAFNPRRRRYDERVAQKTVRIRVAEAVRRLAGLGFVELADGEQLRLRPALLRFAEPVRGLTEPAEALAQLVARGEIALEVVEAAEAVEDADVAQPPQDGGEDLDADGADTDSRDQDREDADDLETGDNGGEHDSRTGDVVGAYSGSDPDDHDSAGSDDDPEIERGAELAVEAGPGGREAGGSALDDERDVVAQRARRRRLKRDGDPP
jgi:chromosome partition protein MukE